MKIIAKNGKKILKMSKEEWFKLGRQYRWAELLPDPQKVKEAIEIIRQLHSKIESISEESIYKFLPEMQHVANLDSGMRRILEIISALKAKQSAKQSSSTLLQSKTAQNLEVVKTPEKFTDRETTRAIRDAIIAEEIAIKQYETIVDASDNARTKEILQDIANEERVHVGELQELLRELLRDEEGFLNEGAKEVNEKNK